MSANSEHRAGRTTPGAAAQPATGHGDENDEPVVVIRTGAANLASVVAGFGRLGYEVELSLDPKRVAVARRVVLPGVGAFGPARARLARDQIDAPLAERIRAGRPTLAICLGLQLLCERSDESPDAEGLACVPGSVHRFAANLRVPQLGWNRVEPTADCRLLQPGYAYFANSFRLDTPPAGWSVAYSDYGGPFVAAMERGAVLACQFHPELSGPWGASVLRHWLDAAATPEAEE